jgi:hypothetical protein
MNVRAQRERERERAKMRAASESKRTGRRGCDAVTAGVRRQIVRSALPAGHVCRKSSRSIHNYSSIRVVPMMHTRCLRLVNADSTLE